MPRRIATLPVTVLAALAVAVAPARAADPAPVANAPSSPQDIVVVLADQARVSRGCAPLQLDPRLRAAATAHATDMARQNYFSHTSMDRRSFDQRIRTAGYPGVLVGENIASGFPTAAEVHAGWMSVPVHRDNILNCAFRRIGVGYADPGQYWVVTFGG